MSSTKAPCMSLKKWKAPCGVSDTDLFVQSYPLIHFEYVDCFVVTEKNDNEVTHLFLLQPILVSMKISLVTVIPWRKQLAVNMNCSRKSARLLAYVKAKFTEMPNLHCAGLSGENLHHLVDTYQEGNCSHVSYKFDSKQ